MDQERFLRLDAVEQMTGLKRAHIYGLARRGKFPKPIKIGVRASAWRASQIRDWIDWKCAEAEAQQQRQRSGDCPATKDPPRMFPGMDQADR